MAGIGAALMTGGSAPSGLFKMPDISTLLGGLSGFGGGTTVKTNQSLSTSLSNQLSIALNTISGGGTTGAATATPTATQTPTASASEPSSSSYIPSFSVDPGYSGSGTGTDTPNLTGLRGNYIAPIAAIAGLGVIAFFILRGRK